MQNIEKLSYTLRHSAKLESAHGLWNTIRPIYNRVLALFNRRGLKRNINGTDPMRVAPLARGVVNEYEPEVWRSLMAEVRAGDVFADVGAFFGLYAVALAKRVGKTGRVVAFEPEPFHHSVLKQHVSLNYLRNRLEVIQAVVGTENGRVAFESNGTESHAVTVAGENSTVVQSVSLDHVFAGKKLDILKIDVEGYEENVLKGAAALLSDSERRPRAIYIEVHPFAWPDTGASSQGLLQILGDNGYQVTFVDGRKVQQIEEYGEIIARQQPQAG